MTLSGVLVTLPVAGQIKQTISPKRTVSASPPWNDACDPSALCARSSSRIARPSAAV
jgi:hypothetical protein